MPGKEGQLLQPIVDKRNLRVGAMASERMGFLGKALIQEAVIT